MAPLARQPKAWPRPKPAAQGQPPRRAYGSAANEQLLQPHEQHRIHNSRPLGHHIVKRSSAGPLDLSAPAWKVWRQAASKIQGLVRAKAALLMIIVAIYEIGYDGK